MAPLDSDNERWRILVVDDEPNIADVIAVALRYKGYKVAVAASGEEALGVAVDFRPDLIVLDIMLPGLDGFEVAQRLRANADKTPVLFLSARDGTEEKVRGLELGGDDYMTKPFSVEELLSRTASVLRRCEGSEGGGRLRFADLELDEATMEVRRAGAPIELTLTEFRLLAYLMRNPRLVLSQSQILEQVWEPGSGGDVRNLGTFVSTLRKKLEAHGPRLLQTIRGAGYVLRPPPS